MTDLPERLRRLYAWNGTNHVQEAADEIERLRAERDALAKDAERYRWLRGDSCPGHSVRWAQWEIRCWQAPFWTGDLRRADLDDAIDAARGSE